MEKSSPPTTNSTEKNFMRRGFVGMMNKRAEKLIKALNESFGTWENRNLNPESFVRKLREGNRLEEKITAKDILEMTEKKPLSSEAVKTTFCEIEKLKKEWEG